MEAWGDRWVHSSCKTNTGQTWIQACSVDLPMEALVGDA